MLNAETRQILDYQQLNEAITYKINKEHVSLKKQAL
jgi:translation initiation factor eIF-2B subunit epsilon